MNKRITALILSLLMVFGLLPVTAAAAPDPLGAAVYITVSVAGEIPWGRDYALMVQAPVTVTDKNENGSLDLDDALFALHEAYYSGGAAAGYAGGAEITKLWGDTSLAYGFLLNKTLAASLTETVQPGDYITAFVYEDGDSRSDSCAVFDTFTKTAAVGERISLTLETEDGTALEGASIHVLDRAAVLAETDESGEAALSFPAAGTYYITASRGDLTLVPPLCVITVTAPESCATVRIEGNGFGTDASTTGLGTVLSDTMVNLDLLPADYRAIDVVNAALEASGLPAAVRVSEDYYKVFGGVGGQSGQGWHIMLNDEAALDGLDTLRIAAGDKLVLMLTGYDENWNITTNYACFKTVHSSSALKYGSPYGEVTLALYSKKQDSFTSWSETPVPYTAIYCNGSQAWTPDDSLAATDAVNGLATITLWGGMRPGIYYFDISAEVYGATAPYCRATMVYDGENAPTLSFSAPSESNTTLSRLTLSFPEAASSGDGLPYVGKGALNVGYAVTSVVLDGAPSDPAAAITATYQAAGGGEASAYDLGEIAGLAVGENFFRLTVTNGEESRVHTLVISRGTSESRDIAAEAAAVINGVKAVTGDAPFTDWILAMHAAGLSPTAARREEYLAAVLTTADNFADHGTGSSPARIAKIAIALTALGIDARQIPDPDGGEAIDLIQLAASHDMTANPVYGAPYLLSLYDLGNYEIPDGAANTRQALIEAILDAEDQWAAGGVDGIGMVLPALAPYYGAAQAVNGIGTEKCGEITAAVNRALKILSDTQTVDGGFGAPNSNTVSTVLTGLNAIGIDAHTSEAFTKSGTSVLMNLLSFRTGDDKLGFTDASAADIMACNQGFQALATWQNLKNARSSNLYHFEREIAPYTNWPAARLLTSIAVTKPPTKLVYDLGTADTAPDMDGIEITATYNADGKNTEPVDIGKCEVSAIDCSKPGTKTVTVSYQGKTATFLVAVRKDDGSMPEQKTVSVTVKNGGSIIARSTSVVIEAGETTALDVLKTVLEAAGKTYVIRNGVYVAEIDGKGEFDKGSNSGWLYSINGTAPSTTSASEYALQGGEAVVWYYTLDYTTDPSSAAWTGTSAKDAVLTPKATARDGAAAVSVSATDMDDAIAAVKKNDGSLITIAPEITGKAAKVSVELPKSALSDMGSGTKADLKIVTANGSVTIANDALAALAAQAQGSTITIVVEAADARTLSAGQQKAVDGKTLFDISVTSGGKPIDGFGGKSITISLPYALKAGEVPEGVTVWYMDGEGQLERLSCSYDKANGLAAFTTAHLSYFAVGYEAWQNPFTDVKIGDWFYDAVKFAVENQLFTGISEDAFAPNTDMTRAMLVTVLYRLEGKPAVTGANLFTDVKAGEWYAGAVIWAAANGIVTGYGDSLFGVNDPVTREQMAAILYRYAGFKRYDTAKTKDLAAYTDADSVATYALSAMKWAAAENLVTGRTPTTLAPSGAATRAEVAAILMRFADSVGK